MSSRRTKKLQAARTKEKVVNTDSDFSRGTRKSEGERMGSVRLGWAEKTAGQVKILHALAVAKLRRV